MPKYEKYYVVEFRFAIKVDEADSVAHAVSKGSRMCERVYGFKPDNWFARIFEYETGESKPGLSREYFYNPNNSSHREISKNVGYHKEMSEKGLAPEDVDEYTFYEGQE